MYKESFPSKLKHARIDAGFSQTQIKDLTGINQDNLSKYENGHLEPNIEKLGILIDLYEVKASWILSTKE